MPEQTQAAPQEVQVTPELTLLDIQSISTDAFKSDPLRRYRDSDPLTKMLSTINRATTSGDVVFKSFAEFLETLREDKVRQNLFNKILENTLGKGFDLEFNWENRTMRSPRYYAAYGEQVEVPWSTFDEVLESNFKACFDSRGNISSDNLYRVIYGGQKFSVHFDLSTLAHTYLTFYRSVLDMTTWEIKDTVGVSLVAPVSPKNHENMLTLDVQEIKMGLSAVRKLLNEGYTNTYYNPWGEGMFISRSSTDSKNLREFYNTSSNISFFNAKGGHTKAQEGDVYFGLEIEMEFDSANICNLEQIKVDVCLHPELKGYMFAKDDGSLDHGIEFVTAPATMEVHREKLKVFYSMPIIASKYVRSQDTDDKCHNPGLHIHINRDAFTPDTFAKFAKFLGGTADNIPFVRALSRRENSRRNGNPFYYCNFNGIDYNRAKKMHETKRGAGEKFLLLNTEHDHTYEVRMFAGAGKYDTAMLSLEFMWAAYRFCSVQGRYKLGSGDFVRWLQRWAPRKANDFPHLIDFLLYLVNKDLKPTKVKKTVTKVRRVDCVPTDPESGRDEEYQEEIEEEVPPTFINLEQLYDELLKKEIICAETDSKKVKEQKDIEKVHKERSILIERKSSTKPGNVPAQFREVYDKVITAARESTRGGDPFNFNDTGVYYARNELELLVLKPNQFVTSSLIFRNDKKTLANGDHEGYFLVTVVNEQNKEYTVEPITNFTPTR